ncbi:MAG: urate hydroxylase PuuD [Candidatus Eisenbacteria bacterium]|uniref:Urate hydroxylase PuuD n=1 Tax=Eiseniibacteriota bacterium TaxID=2212470 RepID=A0A849SGD2_UNCEI|nr:urate hydroxylase PuuD [Candidatus Eisenbacteria bacterium]
MTPYDWLNLLLRWSHLIAGIAWIGSSFYFIWLDGSLEKPAEPREGVEGEIWMVHSGGFYHVERRRLGPNEIPPVLHWFKWEAAITWMTGVALLIVVYYLTGGVYLLDPRVSGIDARTGVIIGVATLIGGWFVYDLLWRSPLGRIGWPATAISFALLGGVTYAMCHLLSGRAAFLHVGALMGSIMVANVWGVILPSQTAMLEATRAGRPADQEHSRAAKRRSVHNSYMTFPVLFIMLSNHFAGTYGHALNWVVLCLLIVFGASVRHLMIGSRATRAWAMASTAVSLGIVLVMTAPPARARGARASGAPPSFSEVKNVVHSRCVYCHSSNPVEPTFGPAPGGVSFDDPASIVKFAERIRVRAVETQTMPLANQTGMTPQERDLLARWIAHGAHGE